VLHNPRNFFFRFFLNSEIFSPKFLNAKRKNQKTKLKTTKKFCQNFDGWFDCQFFTICATHLVFCLIIYLGEVENNFSGRPESVFNFFFSPVCFFTCVGVKPKFPSFEFRDGRIRDSVKVLLFSFDLIWTPPAPIISASELWIFYK
jgi:hypothetical protein